MRAATSRPRVLVVELPGGARARMAAERELDRRGWPTGTAPGSTDVLVLAGHVPDELTPAVDLIWDQLPGPRARARPLGPDDVVAQLEAAQASLRDDPQQRIDARERDREPAGSWVEDDLPLAEGDDDRDGLEMDVLVHPLGPLLDHWPGGLELRTRLHGDVVAHVEVHRPASPAHLPAAVAAWDAVARVLALVGDDVWARRARAVRDQRPGPEPDGGGRRVRAHLTRLARHHVLPHSVTDVLGRLLDERIDVSTHRLDDAALASLLEGRDLGDVRLLVAAHAPLLATTAAGAGRG
ncbi:hypothetical protein ABKW28_14980 [Nocardioides sp. 31GB23]|uniref:hypothetical protein n=1 Tax=Nocardioides sp. 31GB23 TaxID=3156065 RepID=UPI0032AF853D